MILKIIFLFKTILNPELAFKGLEITLNKFFDIFFGQYFLNLTNFSKIVHFTALLDNWKKGGNIQNYEIRCSQN